MIGLRNYARISKSKIRYILSRFNSSAIKVDTKSTSKELNSKCSTCNLKQNKSSHNDNFNKDEESTTFKVNFKRSEDCFKEFNNINNSLSDEEIQNYVVDTYIEYYCSNYCTHYNNTSDCEEFYYAYIKEFSYGKAEIITNSFKSYNISKSAIKQYLLYHFIPGNQNWLKKSVSYKDISKLTNLSLPTVKKNHQILVEAGLIYSTDLGLGKFNFMIADECNNHLNKDEGGKGYISISLNSLKHLISFNSINELRVELIKFLWVDARSSNLGKKVKFNRENLIEFLPNYIKKSKKKTTEIINSNNSLFECKNNDRLNTSKYETSKNLLHRLKQEAKHVISDLFKNNEDVFSSNYCNILSQMKCCHPYLHFIKDDLQYELDMEKNLIIKNLAELAVQYGIPKVESAIKYMLSDAHVEILDSNLDIKETDIKNPGAFVRTLIVNSINKNGSLENNVA